MKMKPHCSTCTCFESVKHYDRSYIRIKYIYKAWNNIRFRLLNSNSPDYKNYGGRGIGMCQDWLDNYKNFQDYILSTISERPVGCSLDRIDNNKGYEPNNIRWATYKEQIKNRRSITR